MPIGGDDQEMWNVSRVTIIPENRAQSDRHSAAPPSIFINGWRASSDITTEA